MCFYSFIQPASQPVIYISVNQFCYLLRLIYSICVDQLALTCFISPMEEHFIKLTLIPRPERTQDTRILWAKLPDLSLSFPELNSGSLDKPYSTLLLWSNPPNSQGRVGLTLIEKYSKSLS